MTTDNSSNDCSAIGGVYITTHFEQQRLVRRPNNILKPVLLLCVLRKRKTKDMSARLLLF